MPHDGSHTHGGGGDGTAVLVIVAGVVVVALVPVVLLVLHILVMVATGIGFAVLAGGGLACWWKLHQLRGRRGDVNRTIRENALVAAPSASPGEFHRRRSVATSNPGQKYELPAASGDLHVHLPANLSAEDVARVLRGQQ
jgi:hypothetical protein